MTLRSLQRSSSGLLLPFLWFAKRANQTANRFLAVALAIAVLWITRILVIDILLVLLLDTAILKHVVF